MKIQLLQVAPLGTNCYIVCDENAKLCAVVDPGGDAARIDRAVKDGGYTPVCILLTHGHYDHTGGVAELQKLWPGVPTYLSKKDRFPAGSAEARLFLPLEGDVRDYGEGDVITVGELEFRVMSTPGHSEGSVTIRVGDVLLCGDTLFAGSCGRTDFTGGSMRKMMDSLKRLAQLEGDLDVLPGHMDLSDLETERAHNPYMIQALRN